MAGVWDESKHPREFHGHFASVLAGLKSGDSVSLKGSGVKVTAGTARSGVRTRRVFSVQHPNAVGTKRSTMLRTADEAALLAQKTHEAVTQREGLRAGSRVAIGRPGS